jgi:archaeosortase B (VPXXXP-CTERM-specific)
MSESDGPPESHTPPEPNGDANAGEQAAAQERGGLWARIKGVWINPAYRFVFLFLLYLGLIAWLYPIVHERHMGVIDRLAVWTAWVEYWSFRVFTSAVTLSDKVVVFQGFAVKIIEECTGIYEVLIFTAAVMAFPTSWSKRAIGLGMGIPLLYLFNVVRIAVLILVGKYAPGWFDFMHLYFWQGTLILMITSVWLLWITKVVKNDGAHSVASA